MSRPRLAVIIVSYNVRELLAACLASVASSTSATAHLLDVATIVVDNASFDGSAEMVTARFPDVDLVASPTNLGFTRGNNVALERLGFLDPTRAAQRPDYVLLLNPDTEVVGDALWQMVDFLARHPHAAVCGAGLHYSDGGFQHSAFSFPGLAQVMLDLFPPSGLPGAHRLLNSRINGRYPSSLWQTGKPFAVDFVLGAAMMVRGDAIAQVGGLDEGYWMYCEEMDWCRQFQLAGWSIHVLPGARILHHEAQSSRQFRWQTQERLWRSRFRFYAKYPDSYPPGAMWLMRRIVRAGMRRQARIAARRFAAGELDGVELGQALGVYETVAAL